MKIKLLRDARVTVKAGETVDVSPETAAFLLSIGSAVSVLKKEGRKDAKPSKTRAAGDD